MFIGQVTSNAPHTASAASVTRHQGIDQAGLCASLDACLLSEEEFALQPGDWKGLCDDPFETEQVCACVNTRVMATLDAAI